MTPLLLWLPPELVDDAGWILIHFVWEAALIGLLLYTVLPLCRSPIARHNWALSALAAMVVSPVASFLFMHTANSDFLRHSLLSRSDLLGLPSQSIPPLWVEWLVLLWMTGVAILTIRALGGWYVSGTLTRHGIIPLPAAMLDRCDNLVSRFASNWRVRFLQSKRVVTPVVIGWFRPVVLLPISTVAGLPPAHLDALVLHELAHIRRLDTFINLFVIAVETIFFYHPAVWWVGRVIRLEREHCCDDLAVSAGCDALTFAEALSCIAGLAPALTLPAGANEGALKQRIRRVLRTSPDPRRSVLSAVTGLALFFLVAACVTIAANTPHFAIRVVDDSVAPNSEFGAPGDVRTRVLTGAGETSGTLWLKRAGGIEGDAVSEAHVSIAPGGEPLVMLSLTPVAREQFAALSSMNVGHRLAIIVNGTVIDAPVVKEPMVGGHVQLSGNFTRARAAALVDKIAPKARSAEPYLDSTLKPTADKISPKTRLPQTDR